MGASSCRLLLESKRYFTTPYFLLWKEKTITKSEIKRFFSKHFIDHNADFNLRNKAGEKPIDVTDDQDTIFYLNRLIRWVIQPIKYLLHLTQIFSREQRQKARQRAREIHEVHENTLNKFNRSQSSRRSARSLSFRRRSYRKNNTQVQVASNSDSQLLQNPAREEARLEAQYWRGDRQKNVKTSPTKSSSPVGKTSLPSSPTREVEKVNKAVVITNPNIEKRNSQSPSDLYKTSRLNSQSPVNKSSPNRAAGQQPKSSSSCCVIL